MSDGRFYTYDQFISIFLITVAILLSLIYLISSYNRRKYYPGIQFVNSTFLLITIILIIKFIECLVIQERSGYILKYFESVAFIISNILFYYYIVVYLFPILSPFSKSKKLMFVSHGLIILFILFLVVFGFKTDFNLLISEYSFSYFKYSKFYIVILVSIIAFLIMASINVLFKKEEINDYFGNKSIWSIIVVMYLIPISTYLYIILSESTIIKYYEIIFLFLLLWFINITINIVTPYGVTSKVFDKICDVVLDYIFIIDKNSNIVFRNEKSYKNIIFNSLDTIDIGNINRIFNGEILKNKDVSKKQNISVLNNGLVYYFTYGINEIKENEKIVGYMITITDTTELVSILISAEDKKNEIEKINRELIGYAGTVYNLEKEKSINKLLEDFLTSHDIIAKELNDKIDFALMNYDEIDLEKYIDEIIDYNRQNLLEVKKAVKTYKEYYGG